MSQPFDHTVLIFQTWKELRLPDPASWSLKWNGTIHVNQRAKMPNTVSANRETCKSAENALAPYYMVTSEEKQIDTHSRMEWQMYSQIMFGD